jgi:hypothetical protein
MLRREQTGFGWVWSRRLVRRHEGCPCFWVVSNRDVSATQSISALSALPDPLQTFSQYTIYKMSERPGYGHSFGSGHPHAGIPVGEGDLGVVLVPAQVANRLFECLALVLQCAGLEHGAVVYRVVALPVLGRPVLVSRGGGRESARVLCVHGRWSGQGALRGLVSVLRRARGLRSRLFV